MFIKKNIFLTLPWNFNDQRRIKIILFSGIALAVSRITGMVRLGLIGLVNSNNSILVVHCFPEFRL